MPLPDLDLEPFVPLRVTSYLRRLETAIVARGGNLRLINTFAGAIKVQVEIRDRGLPVTFGYDELDHSRLPFDDWANATADRLLSEFAVTRSAP